MAINHHLQKISKVFNQRGGYFSTDGNIVRIYKNKELIRTMSYNDFIMTYTKKIEL